MPNPTGPNLANRRELHCPGRAGMWMIPGVAVLAIAAAIGGWWLSGDKGSARSNVVATPIDGPAWFEDTLADSNVDFRHSSAPSVGYRFPEIISGGVCLFDYDMDGDLDLYFVQGGDVDSDRTDGPGNRLYSNRGNAVFDDVTDTAGVGDTAYGIGCTCGDYDADGDVDLYVTNLGPNVLYRNNGDGTFTDVTGEAGVGDAGWSSSSAFLDYDSDGDLDLYVVNYINWALDREIECFTGAGIRDYCSPNNYNAPAPDSLYRNDGAGVFTDVSNSSGIRATFGNGLGVAWGDYNSDGRVDIYVANDGMPNQLWINQGDGRFSDDALISGCAVNVHGLAEAGMGVMTTDIDNDGDLDLFMSHLREESNTFYVNRGGMFDDATARLGLASPSVGFTGFGLGLADFDHDGRLDIYVANGAVKLEAKSLAAGRDPYVERNQLFARGNGDRFEEVVPLGGTSEPLLATSRGAAIGDLDNDGDLDIVVANKDSRPHILRNLAGSRGGWIMFRVLDRRGVDALGAAVQIVYGGEKQWRFVQRAYGYCSAHDPRVHFGLAEVTGIDSALVRWPNGGQETFGPFEAGGLYVIREGTGRNPGYQD
ncbi:MAG: CRTAC1 family protein [Acidobacteria bacterium]|nr:CRTAC1 family protein [Acidobacteriota bacterium]